MTAAASPAPIGRTPGRLITLEGGEGTGKSTQARLLASWLLERGIPVELTREPGGTAGAEQIRALLVAGASGRWLPASELLLHYAARLEHVGRLIAPALAAGRWVVCDRFIDSTMAYQGHGQGLTPSTIDALRRLVLPQPVPDLTIVLDVAPELRRARMARRAEAETRYEAMDEAFHARVRAGFRAIADGSPERAVLLDATGDPSDIAQAIRSTVATRLGLGP